MRPSEPCAEFAGDVVLPLAPTGRDVCDDGPRGAPEWSDPVGEFDLHMGWESLSPPLLLRTPRGGPRGGEAAPVRKFLSSSMDGPNVGLAKSAVNRCMSNSISASLACKLCTLSGCCCGDSDRTELSNRITFEDVSAEVALEAADDGLPCSSSRLILDNSPSRPALSAFSSCMSSFMKPIIVLCSRAVVALLASMRSATKRVITFSETAPPVATS
mmetsp:Transcript_49649/g.118226  ORF Transcript_49649/g.118226 Transcript_49649/m.118226 type:complete len:215 (+) Transcript_49649:536-1180(+)